MHVLRSFPVVLLIASAVLLTLAILYPQWALAATAAIAIPVNSTADDIDDDVFDGVCHSPAGGPGQGKCTLRAAVMQANQLSGTDFNIIVPSGIYTLTRPPDVNNFDSTGDLNLKTPPSGESIHIIGSGTAKTIIDGGQLDRVFRVEANRPAYISYLTIRNGATSGGFSGGGLLNSGVLELNEVSFLKNYSAINGGAIQNIGTLTINKSTLEENTADTFGGGIYNNGTASIYQSLIYNNSAYDGGGVYNDGTTILVNTTLSANNAVDDGGGIANHLNSTSLYNASVVFNQADSDMDFDGEAGGIFNAGGATVSLRNSILAGNYYRGEPTYYECYGTLTLSSYNATYTDDFAKPLCTFDGSGTMFLLNGLHLIGPLAKNGGPTRTHALLKGSNAIDLGSTCSGPFVAQLPTDQRGSPRVIDGNSNGAATCDLGAYEYLPPLYLPMIRR